MITSLKIRMKLSVFDNPGSGVWASGGVVLIGVTPWVGMGTIGVLGGGLTAALATLAALAAAWCWSSAGGMPSSGSSAGTSAASAAAGASPAFHAQQDGGGWVIVQQVEQIAGDLFRVRAAGQLVGQRVVALFEGLVLPGGQRRLQIGLVRLNICDQIGGIWHIYSVVKRSRIVNRGIDACPSGLSKSPLFVSFQKLSKRNEGNEWGNEE